MKLIVNTLLVSVLFTFIFEKTFSQAYFQQEVNYKIDVRLNDNKHELSAFETIEYVNNSPDELKFLYFHLWPNAYDNNNTALGKQILNRSRTRLFKDEERRGYIDSLEFKVNGQKIKWEYDKENIDICKLILNEPLKPGEKINISTPFRVKLPKGITSRLGHVGQTYQITQWYPKPAVYDKYGWHQFPYLDMGEFYSEFGSFDVSITLPKNYVVGATGDLQNPEELEWLTKLAEETSKIDSFDKKNKTIPESSNEYKTIRYVQKNIHDFAWFADKRFHVLKGEREMPHTGKKVTTWAMFPNRNADLWMDALEYIGDALYYYSLWTGDYPYNNCTAVHSSLSAGGGMEYPNITVIGNSQTDRMLEMVIMHEVGHNWFYGILGFNERKYTWQDEGLNSFTEARYMEAKYGKEDVFYKMIMKEKLAKLFDIEDLRYKKFHELMYLMPARYNMDQSASLSAEEYTNINYGGICYDKTSRIFAYLLNYMGEEKFNSVMRGFYEDWKYKHPYPEDIQKAFEKGSGEDLSWLFNDLIKTTKKVDYKIKKVKNNEIVLENKGQISSPVLINAIKDNETIQSKWFEGFSGTKTIPFEGISDYDKIAVDNEGHMLEIYRYNNYFKNKGIFKKVEPLRLRFLGIVENPERTQINFLPSLGWNNNNKFMLGAAFYSPLLPKNKFEYQIVPMYAFGSNDLAGSANIGYTIFPFEGKFQSIKMSLSGKRYAYETQQGHNFHSLKGEINFLLKNKDAQSKISNRIIVNAIHSTDVNDIINDLDPGYNQFYNIMFSHSNRKVYHPYSFAVNTQLNKDFGKAILKAKYTFWYTKKQAINFNLFAGTFIYQSSDLPEFYNFNLSGIQGINDYTFDHIFFDRFESPENNTFYSKQFIAEEGGFASYSPYANTNDWMVSLNVSADLPYISKILPVEVFFNAASFGNMQDAGQEYTLHDFAWEGGIKVSVFNSKLEVFLPVIMSDELTNTTDLMTNKYLQRVRFSIRLNKFNPIYFIENQLM